MLPHHVGKINYKNFASAITAKFGVVYENWPLELFRCPGEINSRAELETLYQAWKNGVARFRKLSAAELAEWRQAQFEEQLAADRTERVHANEEDGAPPEHQTPSASSPRTIEPVAPSSTPPVAIPDAPAQSPMQDIQPSTGDKRTFSSVLSLTSEGLVPKRKRAKRSDSGTKRGPNVRTTGKATGQENGNGSGRAKGKGKAPATM